MDAVDEFLRWAWARHHNPLSWYIRPLFILPFCYFAYRRSARGVGLTILAVLSSMFWFPAPEAADPRVADFLAMERQHITSPWTPAKVALTALVPAWFVALGAAFWTRSWLSGLAVINGGAALKVLWSFHVAGSSAWSIIPPVALGMLIVNGIVVVAYRRARRSDGPRVTGGRAGRMGPVSIVRWTARIWAVAGAALLLAFTFGGAEPLRLTGREAIAFALFPVGVVAGFAIAWWRELAGGLVTVGSLALFYILELAGHGRWPGLYFLLFAAPGFLHVACALSARTRSPVDPGA